VVGGLLLWGVWAGGVVLCFCVVGYVVVGGRWCVLLVGVRCFGACPNFSPCKHYNLGIPAPPLLGMYSDPWPLFFNFLRVSVLFSVSEKSNLFCRID